MIITDKIPMLLAGAPLDVYNWHVQLELKDCAMVAFERHRPNPSYEVFQEIEN
jgi:hypothetical protein